MNKSIKRRARYMFTGVCIAATMMWVQACGGGGGGLGSALAADERKPDTALDSVDRLQAPAAAGKDCIAETPALPADGNGLTGTTAGQAVRPPASCTTDSGSGANINNNPRQQGLLRAPG